MRHIKCQSNCHFHISVVSLLISFKTFLLTLLLIFATCGVIRSQEPAVVTTVGLNVPLRSSEVQEYIDYLKDSYYVEFERDLMPATFSIGYRITLDLTHIGEPASPAPGIINYNLTHG